MKFTLKQDARKKADKQKRTHKYSEALYKANDLLYLVDQKNRIYLVLWLPTLTLIELRALKPEKSIEFVMAHKQYAQELLTYITSLESQMAHITNHLEKVCGVF